MLDFTCATKEAQKARESKHQCPELYVSDPFSPFLTGSGRIPAACSCVRPCSTFLCRSQWATSATAPLPRLPLLLSIHASCQQLLGLKPLVTVVPSTPARVRLQRVNKKSVRAADPRLACRRLDPGNCTFISLLCWGAGKELGALLFWTEDGISTRGVEI